MHAILRKEMRLSALAVAAALAIGSTSAVTAQVADLNASLKRFNEFNAAGNYAAAIGEGRKLEAAVKARFGTDHANYAIVLNNLGLAFAGQGKHADAEPAALGREAFEIAQWASQSSAAAAVQQMAARFAAGSGALAVLVREAQDHSAARETAERALIAALARPEAQQDRAAIERLRAQIGDMDGRIATTATQLGKRFPDYAALASPRPLEAVDVQRLLGDDEALVFFLTGAKESYVFALTRSGFDWSTIALGTDDLATKAAAFRRGLDVAEFVQSRDPQLFDLALAHDLHSALLAPVEHGLGDG